jgi:cell fate regulator YaaT (PSP1 superfamily)
MNVFDWLSGLPLSDTSRPFPIIEVSFNNGSRKEFFRNNTQHIFEKGEWIAVEGTGGFDLGQVNLQGELVKLQMKKYGINDTPDIKKVLRPADDEDLRAYREQKSREQEIMVRSRAMARNLKLDMKIAEVELQADGKKGTFFYTAEQRVDFRELIKLYANDFRMKIEMRQIGARQESGKVGGIGSCGRELCCSTWLTDFKSVNTAAARYQNLSINQTKLSGQCGRLKCCLNYELDTYMDALRAFPTDADSIETAQGRASLQKRDIFRNVMWYSYHGSNKQYPMTIERVLEIKALNKEGIKPEELGATELEKRGAADDSEADKGFVNDVGQISLRALERNSRNRKKKAADSKKPVGGRGEQGSADNIARPHRQQKTEGGSKPEERRGGNQPKQGLQQPKQAKQPRPEGEGQQPKAPQQQRPQKQPQQQREGQQARPQQGEGQQQKQQSRPARQPRPEGESQPKPEQPQRQPKPQSQQADGVGGEGGNAEKDPQGSSRRSRNRGRGRGDRGNSSEGGVSPTPPSAAE